MEHLYINTVIEHKIGSNEKSNTFIERIIYIGVEKDCVQTIELNIRSSKMHDYSLNELYTQLKAGEISIVPEPIDRSMEFFHLKEKQTKMLEIERRKYKLFQGPLRKKGEYEKRYEKWEEKFKRDIKIVETIFPPGEEPEYYMKRKNHKRVKEACEKYQVSKNTVYRIINKYLQAGRSTDALYVTYYGANQIKNKKIQNKLGRPCEGVIKGTKGGVNITEEIKQLFVYSICRWYESKNGHSLKATHDMLINEMFKEEQFSRNAMETGVAAVPTYRQFKYWYDNEYKCISRQLISRKGEKEFLNNSKGLNADILSEATVPMQIVYVDATIADVYLKSRISGKAIALRPTIYIGIDGATEMIVGFHVSLEPPGIAPLLSLLYSIIEDKQVLGKQLGIELPKEAFPFAGVPMSVLGDRGEMVSAEFRNVVKSLRSTLKNTSSYLGAAKGLVEQSFNTININVNEWMPGKIEKHYRQRGQKDYRYNAKMDVEEFTEVIVKLIIHHNKRSLINRKRTRDMTKDDIGLTPIQLWEHGVKQRGALIKIPTQELIMKLLRVGQASLTERGIYFFVSRAYYECNHPKYFEWKVEARARGRKSISVKYDNRNLDTIFLILDNETEIIPCKLSINYQEYEIVRKCSESEVSDYYENENNKRNEDYLSQVLNNNEFIEGREESILKAQNNNQDEVPVIKNTQKEQYQARQENKKENALINRLEYEQQKVIDTKWMDDVEEISEDEEVVSNDNYKLLRKLQMEE